MRKIIISILMASAVAAPAAAQRQHSWGDDSQSRSESRESRQQARDERQQSRDESRQARQEQIQARQEAQQQARSEALAARTQASDRNVSFSGDANQGGARAHAEGRASRADFEAIRAARAAQLEAQAQAQSERRGTTHQWSSPEAEQRNRALRQNRGDGTLRQSDREVPRTFRNRVPVVSDTPREGTQPPLRVRSRDHAAQSWSTRWRHDGRYDWQNYRNRHRSLFRLGYYYDPFGWNYQSYDIGWRMWPSYYSNRFWISDPWQYRLPYAPPGYRWIRYWDDAILVDTWSGEVVDVLYNFFW